ncbi:MAG: molybdopterin-synthase adenylyltransferase MoeB [Cyclobacteriaceae bacterium]|nr:molybdopterin-synthase adenylyltransferase MoeB [Cyclobacteriaceae bacterium]
MFSQEELKRYSRQMLLPDLGQTGQQRIKEGSVLVIGAGGLGSPALYYLTAAGVGRLGIVDFDLVDESNLHRQILFTTKDIGKKKTEQAGVRLRELNPNVKIELHDGLLNSDNAMKIISSYDVIIDGSDNLPTRYLVNDACVLLKKTLIYGAIFQFEGQVSVFNHLNADGKRGPNYRDLFPEPPPPEMVPSCSVGGVLGVLPGIIGSMQANEALKVLTGIGTTLSGRLMIYDALDFTTRFLNLKSNVDNPVSGINPTITKLIDYEAFCKASASTVEAKEISPLEVRELLRGDGIQLIDVRESFEFDIVNIGGVNIPIDSLLDQKELLKKDRMIIVYCKSGQRGAIAARKLRENGFENAVNMKGGLIAWKAEVNKDLTLY